MPRREIINHITGPNGNWTQSFGPETIRILKDLGLIKEVEVITSGDGGDVTYENHLYEKA